MVFYIFFILDAQLFFSAPTEFTSTHIYICDPEILLAQETPPPPTYLPTFPVFDVCKYLCRYITNEQLMLQRQESPRKQEKKVPFLPSDDESKKGTGEEREKKKPLEAFFFRENIYI